MLALAGCSSARAPTPTATDHANTLSGTEETFRQEAHKNLTTQGIADTYSKTGLVAFAHDVCSGLASDGGPAAFMALFVSGDNQNEYRFALAVVPSAIGDYCPRHIQPYTDWFTSGAGGDSSSPTP